MTGRVFKYGEGNSLIYPHNDGISIPHNDTLYTFEMADFKLNSSCVFDFQIQRPNSSMSPQQIKEYLQQCSNGEIPSSLYGLQMLDEYIFGMFNYGRKVKHVLISMADGKSIVSSPTLGKDGIPILPISYTDNQEKNKFIMTVLPAFFVKSQKTIQENSLLYTIEKELENEECNPSLIFYKMRNRSKL